MSSFQSTTNDYICACSVGTRGQLCTLEYYFHHMLNSVQCCHSHSILQPCNIIFAMKHCLQMSVQFRVLTELGTWCNKCIIMNNIDLQAFGNISDSLRADRLIYPHFRYYVREVRVVAYAQVDILPAAQQFFTFFKQHHSFLVSLSWIMSILKPSMTVFMTDFVCCLALPHSGKSKSNVKIVALKVS